MTYMVLSNADRGCTSLCDFECVW